MVLGARSRALAAACSDGTVRFFLRDGRVERTVEAHVGAVTSVRWTRDGACLLTSGEDGAVKSWSPSGRPLGVVAAGETAVYAAAWSPESHASGGATGRVVVARGKNLRVHAANAGVREGEGSRARRETGDRASANAFPAWRAHDGVVLWDGESVAVAHAVAWVVNFLSFFFLYPSVFNLKEVAAVEKPQVHLWVLP